MAEILADSYELIKADSELKLRRIVKNEKQDLISKLHWSMAYTRRKMVENGEAPHQPIMQVHIEGSLRGELGERISRLTPISECQTVYSTTDETLFILGSFTDATGKKVKRDILNKYILDSLNWHTPDYILEFIQNPTVSIDERKKFAAIQIASLADLYWKFGGASGEGDLFKRTIIPDDILFDRNCEIVGPSEVKSYTPDLVHELVSRLPNLEEAGLVENPTVSFRRNIGKHYTQMDIGVDLQKEVDFIDFVRNVGYGLPKLGKEMPILLRFPDDAPTCDLQQYGKFIRNLGYPHILIQKIPVTSVQLSQSAIVLLQNNIESIKYARTFKAKDIRSMENLIFGEST